MVKPFLERSIHFYLADIGRDEAGDPIPFDFASLLAKIERLTFAPPTGPSRYEWENEDSTLLADFSQSVTQDEFRFCRARYSDLPELERHGNITPLELAADQGVLDTSHVVFFPGNVVGIEYSRYGPDANRLGWYLAAKSGNFLRSIELRHLVRTDPVDRLDGLRDLRSLVIEVRTPYVAIVQEEAPGLGGVLTAVRDAAAGGETVRAVVTFPRGTHRSALVKYGRQLGALLRRPDVANIATKFSVRGKHHDTDKVDLVDFLGDRIVSKKKIDRAHPTSRTVDPQSAFEAIREAYDELSQDIQMASTLELFR